MAERAIKQNESDTLEGGRSLMTTATAPSARAIEAIKQKAKREMPHSGKPEELIDAFGISGRHIVEAVRAIS